MKKNVLFITLLFTVVFFPGLVHSVTVEEVLKASGSVRQLDSLPETLKAAVNRDPSMQGGGNPIASIFSRAVDESIQPIIIRNNIRNLLKKNMNPAELEELMQWYGSSLGRRIARAEEHASSPEGYNEMYQVKEQLNVSDERMKILEDLEKASGTADFSYDLQVGTQLGMVAAMNRLVNPDAPVNMEMMRMQLQSQEVQMRQVLYDNTMFSLTFIYKDFTDEELRQYVKFLQTPSAKKFVSLASGELLRSLLKGMELLSENIAKAIRAQRSGQPQLP